MQRDVPAVSTAAVDRLLPDVDNDFIIGVPKVSNVACVPAIAAVRLMQYYMRSFPAGLLAVSGLRLFLVYLLLLPYLLLLAFMLLVFLLLLASRLASLLLLAFSSDPDIPLVAGNYTVLCIPSVPGLHTFLYFCC